VVAPTAYIICSEIIDEDWVREVTERMKPAPWLREMYNITDVVPAKYIRIHKIESSYLNLEKLLE
jgi:hypothetical protein